MTAKTVSPALPGGLPQFRSDEWLVPLFQPVPGTEAVRSTEYDVRNTQVDGAETETKTRTEIYREVVSGKEQLIERLETYSEIETPSGSGNMADHITSRNETWSLMYYYTLAYQQAKAEYEQYIKSASCFNANLVSGPGETITPITRALMQWQNFPYMEITETLNYLPSDTEGGVFVSTADSSVTLKFYIYDLWTGAQLLEAQYVYKFWSPNATESTFPVGGNIFNKYIPFKSLAFGEDRAFSGDIRIALESFSATRFIPLTPRIVRVDKTDIANRAQLFTTETEDGDTIPPQDPQLSTSSSTTIQHSAVPRLSRQALLDSQARLGRLVGGDLAAQLTARKWGGTITSNLVAQIVAGVRKGDDYLTAEDAFYAYGKQYDLSELVSLVGTVRNEVESAESLFHRRIAAALEVKVAKVVAVLALYKVRYVVEDVAVLVDFIPQAFQIVSDYESRLQEYLELFACQNMSYPLDLVNYIWSGRQIQSLSAAEKWLELTRRENNGFQPINADTAAKLYELYTEFRRKMAAQDAARQTYNQELKLAGYTQISLATIQYLEEIVLGDSITVNSRRENVSARILGANITINSRTITGTLEVQMT